ncbi:MAG: class I SAM-dependent methyltransferase [Halothiobacillaceae bacterium]|nr:MAG: class I SAM-dependent methyltransferase [Halothiobacillaceae bacterium]
MSTPRDLWNARFAKAAPADGEAPNAFVVQEAGRLPPGGRILLPGDGQGRNSVWMARQGFDVTCVDWSGEGLKCARALAEREGARVETVCADLSTWIWPEGIFDGVVAIHLHLPPATRPMVHRAMLRALRPGGLLLLEAFDLEQINHSSGGPDRLEMLYSAEMLAEDFAEGEILMLERAQVLLDEGPHHQGPAEVVRAVVQQTS